MAAPGLAGKSNSALAMALGMAVQSTPDTLPVGALSAIADELARRGLLMELLDELGHQRAEILGLQITVDRTKARRVARTVRVHHTTR